MSQVKADWIALDWGTSNIRAGLMTANGEVRQMLNSPDGVGALNFTNFEQALLNLIEPHLRDDQATTLIACGMIGAKQGWCEAPYIPVPHTPPLASQAVQVDAQDPRLNLYILPGMCQQNPPDIMRGEETQIAGFLSQNADFSGIICMPGTHTKWVKIDKGVISSFQTFVTGEFYQLLAQQSVVKHSVDEGWDDDAYLRAVNDSFSSPESFTHQLFGIRALDLLHNLPKSHANARLSGLLIGLELKGTQQYWRNEELVLIGSEILCNHYQSALKSLGANARAMNGEDMSIKGINAAYLSLMEA